MLPDWQTDRLGSQFAHNSLEWSCSAAASCCGCRPNTLPEMEKGLGHGYTQSQVWVPHSTFSIQSFGIAGNRLIVPSSPNCINRLDLLFFKSSLFALDWWMTTLPTPFSICTLMSRRQELHISYLTKKIQVLFSPSAKEIMFWPVRLLVGWFASRIAQKTTDANAPSYNVKKK